MNDNIVYMAKRKLYIGNRNLSCITGYCCRNTNYRCKAWLTKCDVIFKS